MPLSATSQDKPTETKKPSRMRALALPVATVILGIVISVGLFAYRDSVAKLGNYGYLGAFVISLVSSATVFLPAPGIVVLVAIGATLNPVLVGLVGAAGAIIGEMTGFMVGYGSHEVIEHKTRLHERMEAFMKRWGGWAIFLFAAVPIPLFDLAGIIAGALHYPLRKFLLIGWAGKSIKFVALVVGGVEVWQALLRFFP